MICEAKMLQNQIFVLSFGKNPSPESVKCIEENENHEGNHDIN